MPVINIPKHRKVYASVQNAIIPYSFYNVNSNNNTLMYTVNGGSVQTLNITEGNYNVNTLITAITSAIPAFTITYSNSTNFLTFTHSKNRVDIEISFLCGHPLKGGKASLV